MSQFKEQVAIPLYGSWLTLDVSNNPIQSRSKYKQFGPIQKGGYVDGIASYNSNGDFALFFSGKKLRQGVITHEVFHITHRILDFHGVKFSPDNHEAHAYLCGWIAQWVDFQLKKHKIKIL